ncbi:MAG: CoA pyrophosphatase [Actinobacteria bacterium]|nr:CoA pyrophosphatase [Actinomycetota bacterium]
MNTADAATTGSGRSSPRAWDALRSALDRDPEIVPPPDTLLAGVLLPVLGTRRPSLVFTKRSEELSRHRGEISFPGGLRHAEDASLRETALRETEEELGVPREAVEVLGALEPVHTFVSGILIVPYVGVLAARPEFLPSPGEIDEVLEYDLASLLAAEAEQSYHTELGTWTGHAYEMDGHVIWGATARILHGFLVTVRRTAPGLVGTRVR